MHSGKLLKGGSRPTVQLERWLPDEPSVLWHAITDRDELRSWFPCDVIVTDEKWTVGAAITFPFPPDVIDMTLTGEVLVADEPHALAYSWGDEVLRFQLSARDDGTALVLVNELDANHAARNAAGWDDCLDRLAGLTPSPDAWKLRFQAYASLFEPELGPQEGPPGDYKGS